jgi:putative endonuclease
LNGDDIAMGTSSYVCILASQRYGTLYIGVTTDLVKRIREHRNESFSASFTGCYNVKTLVWYEAHPDIVAAIRRKKKLKHWQRKWKSSSSVKKIRYGATYMAILLGFKWYGSSLSRG